MMTNSDRNRQIFLSHPQINNGFFFVLEKHKKRLLEDPESAEMRQGDVVLTLQ